MDNGNFPDLGQLLYALKDNPQLLQLLMGMMSAPQKNEPRPPSPDIFSLLSGMQNNASPPPSSEKMGKAAEKGFSGATATDGIFGSSEENAKRINLLNAVRPYLSEGRQARLDSVIKLLKIAGIGGLSKILGGK